MQVKNSTYALWTWHRNQDVYGDAVGDQIYIVRQPELCLDINRENLMVLYILTHEGQRICGFKMTNPKDSIVKNIILIGPNLSHRNQ